RVVKIAGDQNVVKFSHNQSPYFSNNTSIYHITQEMKRGDFRRWGLSAPRDAEKAARRVNRRAFCITGKERGLTAR
ncbi:MAG: hypothetical protein IIU01_05570, partial [Oscillospiraceae bacterium]|nr:hypothetical protein [Oscillospiraceae bacterium]